jgi:hypothetical protein
MKTYITAIISALIISTPALATNVKIFTDKAAWSSAVNGSFLSEDFSDTSFLKGLSINAQSSSFSIADGVMNDRLTNTDSTTISYDDKLQGVGGDFDLSPGGPGMGIKLTLINGSLMSFLVPKEINSNYTGQFFGIVSDTAFSSLKLTAGTQNGFGERYSLDNLVLAAAPVPEPETYALMGMGLIGLIAARRRKTTQPA